MTTLTRDVIRDLLPLYLSGEASLDTAALVRQYLATDSVLAAEAAAARDPHLPETPGPAPTAEKAALDSTRRLLKQRTSTLAVAILFTSLPFSFLFEGSRITFLLIRDAPVVGWTWLATAAVMWASHVYVRRRLRVSGL